MTTKVKKNTRKIQSSCESCAKNCAFHNNNLRLFVQYCKDYEKRGVK